MRQQFYCSTFKICNHLYNVKVSWLRINVSYLALIAHLMSLLMWWLTMLVELSWFACLLDSGCLVRLVCTTECVWASNEGFWNVFYGKRNARYERNNYMHIVSHIAITHNEWPIEHYKYMKTCAEKKHMKITAFFSVRSFAFLVTQTFFSVRMHIIDCAYLTLPYSWCSAAKVFWWVEIIGSPLFEEGTFQSGRKPQCRLAIILVASCAIWY